MDQKIKELIAIGASVAARCQPCLSYHLGKAKELGAKKSEIVTAIRLGEMIDKAGGTKMDDFAKTLLSSDKSSDNKPCCSGNQKNESCCS